MMFVTGFPVLVTFDPVDELVGNYCTNRDW
jgi:hypothetical protein